MMTRQARASVFLIGFFCWLEGAVYSLDQVDLATLQPFKITGQVTNEFEKPIPGAKASLQFAFKEKPISVVSDESGNFEILYPAKKDVNKLPFWELYLWVSAPGYNLKCVRPQMKSGQFLPCQVLLSKEEWIVVVVRDSNGKPCPDAIVEPFYFDVPNGVFYAEQSTGLITILPKELAEPFRVTTDKNGEAELRGLPFRKFNGAHCHTPGMVPQLFRFFDLENLSFELRPTGKISGKVVCDETEIPKPDLTGRKVSVVSKERPRTDTVNRTTPVQCYQQIELDREGRFELEGIVAGDVTVRLDMGDSDLQPIPTKPVSLGSGGEVEIEVEVAKTVSVEGTLLTEDAHEPLASVRIGLKSKYKSEIETWQQTTSDASGKYKFYVHPGEYHISANDMSQSKQADDYTYGRGVQVRIESNMAVCKVRDMLFPRLERETGKLVDADGKAIPNRRVALLPMESNHAIKNGVSDDQGKLDIRYDKQQMEEGRKTRWVIYPNNSKSVDGDVRQFQTLTVKEESPLLLVLLSDE